MGSRHHLPVSGEGVLAVGVEFPLAHPVAEGDSENVHPGLEIEISA